MPLEERVRFEQEDDLTEAAAGAGRQWCQFASEYKQDEFLPAGNARRGGLFALQNAELLPQEQDLNVLVVVSTSQQDEVKHHRPGMG